MKKKTDKKFYVSMRGFIRASIIILILAVITFIIALMINLIGRSESRNLIDTTMENAMKLSEEVGEIGISNITGNERIQYETGAIASLYNGRVIIVSRDYRIIRDTFSNKTEKGDKNYGTYIISGDVMDVMTQKKESKNSKAFCTAKARFSKPRKKSYRLKFNFSGKEHVTLHPCAKKTLQKSLLQSRLCLSYFQFLQLYGSQRCQSGILIT